MPPTPEISPAPVTPLLVEIHLYEELPLGESVTTPSAPLVPQLPVQLQPEGIGPAMPVADPSPINTSTASPIRARRTKREKIFETLCAPSAESLNALNRHSPDDLPIRPSGKHTTRDLTETAPVVGSNASTTVLEPALLPHSSRLACALGRATTNDAQSAAAATHICLTLIFMFPS